MAALIGEQCSIVGFKNGTSDYDRRPHESSANPGQNGLATILVGQRVGQMRYFDAAGFPARTVGMEERKAASR